MRSAGEGAQEKERRMRSAAEGAQEKERRRRNIVDKREYNST